uniref:Unknown protein from spot 168 of 2D-PAGE of etiolated coleoptile (Fragments) n=1 Tax=Zea mays TaxID=4577 RepID=UC07_MAIZE|nr:RecName: Full=Unknown protein from spot 168 of 2D-PAGE of etiolated coleoptile [Zea mays]
IILELAAVDSASGKLLINGNFK